MSQGPQDSIEELLPAYALNALDEDERALVERALEQQPRLRTALAEYLEGFAQLAESQVVLLPSLDLRDRIMAAAGARGPARLALSRTRRELALRTNRGLWAAAAVFALVFVGLGSLAMVQSSRVAGLEAEMASLTTSAQLTSADVDDQRREMASLTASGELTQAKLDTQRREMETIQVSAAQTEEKLLSAQELTYFVAHESTSLTRMWPMSTPMPESKPPRGMLISDPDGGRLLMTLFLAPLAPTQVYQAWVWESDESAFSIAVFDVDDSGYALVPVDFPGRDVRISWLSINISPEGGEDTPTGVPVLAGPVQVQ